MTTYVIRNGKAVLKHGPEDIRVAPRRSAFPAPSVIGDHMGALKSMVDGRLYDSKSALRASYRAAGVEELGNDAPATAIPHERPPVTRGDVEQAVAQVQAGYKPATLDTSIIPD